MGHAMEKDFLTTLDEEVKERENSFNDSKDVGIFKVMTVNEWIADAKTKPIPKQLIQDWWFETETLILFGTTGVGKSILAMQKAEEISQTQRVIYVDLELSEHHLLNRYGEYQFNDNLIRVEINRDKEIFGEADWEKLILESIIQVVEKYNAHVVFIDNITFINNELEKGKWAVSLMRKLHQIKNKYKISMCVMAHTPKRDDSRELSINDLAGSRHIANFADSIIGIGASCRDPEDIRYVKQFKTRYVQKVNHADNVWVARQEKTDGVLKLNHFELGPESDYLRPVTADEKQELENSIIYMHRENPDLSYQQIADRLGNTDKQKVYRVIKKHRNNT